MIKLLISSRSGNIDNTVEMQKKYEEQLAASKKVSLLMYLVVLMTTNYKLNISFHNFLLKINKRYFTFSILIRDFGFRK